ncbi:S-adenosyl-L-methionine-dependent methyltransferase [Backusella circina FSU 941]|nr:S-adenosyl-L-methionine-dependent methyltransferase [Backusella circina FSU 941]
MLDSSDVNTRRVKNSAPNYFEFASATPQPLRKTSSAYNVRTSSTNASAKTSSTTSSVKQIYPDQRSFSLSTVPTTKDGEDSSEIPATYNSDIDYITINNRRYWKDSNNQIQFMLPCDDDESDRLMSLHYILKSVFGGNFISPVREVLLNNKSIHSNGRPRVLDIGCGSGTWILEMATEFPNSDFYGIDQCPLFPVSIKPSNSYFQLHDIPNALPFEDGSFDFVFMRMVVLHLHPDKVVSLLKEVSRILKPGGYFEVVDTDYIIRRSGYVSSTQINEQGKQKEN